MKVAILYQSYAAPEIGGAKKPMKEGGYSDSGADIAYTLTKSGVDVLTPISDPFEANSYDWVFGDTQSEIYDTLRQGVTCLWLNTQLHHQHAILELIHEDVQIVGQDPQMVHRFDDKYQTNRELRSRGFPVVRSHQFDIDSEIKNQVEFSYPLVIKPIRGRGSQGVKLIVNQANLITHLAEIDRNIFGKYFMMESFLPGDEATITIMPAGSYTLDGQTKIRSRPWCLPPVRRLVEGIAPYNGKVSVAKNSKALGKNSLECEEWQNLLGLCSKIGEILGIRAPIRIDCRQDDHGSYKIFDINLKPNMTGKGRPGREDQDGLSTLAAESIGWSYSDLLSNMLQQKWPLQDLNKPKL